MNDDYKDTSNYHGAKGVYEPINVMEHFAKEFTKRGVPSEVGLEICLAIKYLLRIGTKDCGDKELFKAENFIHRARTGNWIGQDAKDLAFKAYESAMQSPIVKQLDEDIHGGK